MDEDTRAAIDDLLKSKGRRTHDSPSERRARLHEEMWRVERARAEARDRVAREDAKIAGEAREWAREPREFRSWETSEVTNLREHIASLSLEPSKACIVLRAPYTTDFLQALYTRVPSTQRKWNEQASVWEIHPSRLSDLKLLLKEWYKDVVIVGVPKQVKATKFDQLMAKLDQEDKTKIYRLLATKYHPDATRGDHDIMVLINQVFKQ